MNKYPGFKFESKRALSDSPLSDLYSIKPSLMRTLILLSLIAATFLATPAFCQTTNGPAAAALPSTATNAPAPKAVEKNPRNIRFQFDGIPYGDVVERFAQMAGKPLISNTNIQGTLTYNDPNPYTYQEALDTLNTVLSMKGLMLVDTGNNLQLVPFKELPQMPHRIMRGIDHTGDVRPGEVVTVVMDIKNMDAKEVADSITPMLSNAGSVAPLSHGRGLIITDRLENIQRMRTLLATIDTEVAQDKQMKTYTLLHASGAIVSDLLNRTFGIATAPKRTQFNSNTKNLDVLPPDPNDYITSVYDDASRTLVLFGPSERIALAEDLINKFEQQEGGAGDVRIYYPQTIKAEDLAQIIRQAIPGVAAPNDNAASAATKARLIADAGQNRLIVAAPIPGQLDQIEQLINRVDKPIHGQIGLTNVAMRSQTIQLTKVFRPRTAEATNLTSILNQALTRRTLTGQIQTTASVSYDPGSQSVIVSGSPGDLQIANDIVTQLETGSSQPTPMQTRFIDVGSAAEAKRLQPLVEQLYRNQVSDGSGATAHAKILTDLEGGRLIVTASEDHLGKIEQLVKQLRVDKTSPRERRLQIPPLQNTKVDVVLKSVTDLVNERMNDQKFTDIPKPSITADSENNRLLVTATADQLLAVEQIVKVVDIAPEQIKRDVRAFPLTSKTAAEIIPLVTQLMEATGNRQLNPQIAPKLMTDPTGKQVLAMAIPADMERIAKFIQQFDANVASSVARHIRMVQLSSKSATELTPLVQKLYAEQLRGQLEPQGGPATLIPDPKGNQIMVSGSEPEISRVSTIIRQLDPEGKAGAKEETRVIRLKSASASDLSGLLEKSLNNDHQQIRVMLDARSNSLIVSGETGVVQAASEIVQQLDTRPNMQPREMRILELKSADATAITPIVSNVYAEMMKDQHGPDYVSQTKIVPDTTGNRIIVTGAADEISQIADVVQRLDRAPEQAPGARVFKLNSGDATILAPIVAQAMVRFDSRGNPIKRVTVTADDKSNALIVSGTRADLQDVASVIEKLDGDSSETGRERQLKIFPVKSPDPDALAALVTKVFAAQNPGRNTPALVSITPEPAGKRLIVLAPGTLLAQIAILIEALDAKPDQAGRELHAIAVKNSSAGDLLPKVTQIYADQSAGKSIKPATIYADASGKGFTVYGTAEQSAAIQQIVETLDTAQQSARETKVFELGKAAEVQRFLPVVQQLYRDQLTNAPGAGPADAQFVTDGKSGRLIVSARTNQLPAIAEILARVQGSDAGTNQPERETRTIEIGSSADVQRLLPLVQQLYQDQWKDKADLDPADAKILADLKGGRFIVTGKPAHIKQIESIVQQFGGGKAKPETRDTRVFDLSTANAMELATTVRTLYMEQSKTRLAGQTPDTLILPDASSNRIIITGDTNEVEQVEEIIRKLDKVSAQSASTRVFKLKSANPEKISEILSSALVRYDAYGRPQKRVSVVMDSTTRTLIATGDPKELQSASVIIEQLDASLGTQAARQMKVLQVKTGRVAELSAKVRQLYNDQSKSLPELGTVEPLILDDTSSNQLIVAGTEPQLQLIERIAKDLEGTQASAAPRETKIIEVAQTDDVARLMPMVQQLYQEHWKSKDAADPADAQILPDTKNSRFVITGRTNHLAEIAAIISQVTAPSTNAEPRETRVYELKSSTAVELAATVRALYQEELKGGAIPAATQVRILPDANANRLIITGSTNELARVEQIVNKLDQVTSKAGSARVFKLKHANAEQVASVLSTALVQISQYGQKIPRVSVGADTLNNLVVANGEPKDLQTVSVIVEQMDAVTGGEARQMRIIPLKTGSAREFATRLEKLYKDQIKGQATGGNPDALIIGDEESSRLIITASESQLKTIEEIVKQLQEGGAGAGRQLRVVPVQNNSAAAISSMLSQLFAPQIASLEPGERLVVSALADDHTVVLDGPEQVLTRVLELVKTLDTQPDPQDVTQTVKLKKGRAEDLAQAVSQSLSARDRQSVARRVKITPVNGANSLLIHGPKEPVEEVMKIITELDNESSGGEVEIRIYKLENGEAKEVSSVLEQILQNVSRQLRIETGRAAPSSVSVNPRSNSLIISGSAAHFKAVEKLLPTLDKSPERSDRDVQFVWLRKAKAYDVVSKVESIFADRDRGDRPVIESDASNNSITVIAKRGDMKQIQDLISRLDDSSKDSSIQVRLRSIESVGVEQMARMLQNIYPQMSSARLRLVEKVPPPVNATNSTQAVTNAPVAQPIQEPGQPVEVVIAVDKESNSLILSGPGPELDNIDRLISDLSFSFYGNEAEFRVFSLKHADPVVVARMLGDLLKPEPIQVQPGGNQRTVVRQEKPRITVVPEPRTRGIVVRARPTDFALLESIIKQLDMAGEIAQVDFRVIPLTNASPFRMLPLVQQMVTQLNATHPGEQASIMPDPRSRGLLVVARPDIIDQVQKMIVSLDTPAKTAEAEVLIIPLRHSTATQLSQVLQNLVRLGGSGELTPENRGLQEEVRRLKVQNEKGESVSLDLSKPIKISAQAEGGGESGNRLILTSTSENLKALAAVVEMLDTAALTDGVEIKLVPLEHADATTAAQTLTTIFAQGQKLAAGPGGKAELEGGSGKGIEHPFSVSVDQRSNTLILSGRQESLDLALRVIKDLDQKVERFLTEVKLFRLKHASATRVAPLLQSVFAEGPAVPGTAGLSAQVTRLRTLRDPANPKTSTESSARSALVIQADDLSNTLVVSARADTLPLIEDVLEQLDIPAASGLETVRVYPLNHADPVAIMKILNDLYTGPRSANLRTEDKPIISEDARTSSLVVAGNSKAFAMIEALLQQLDQKLPFELRDIHIFPLEHSDAQQVAATLQKMLDARVTQQAALNRGQADSLKVIVIADERSNSLLIGGSKDSFELAESLAKQLDNASPAVSGRIRLVPLDHADSRVIASTLTSLFTARYAAARTPDVKRDKPIILPDPRSNSLLVAANMDDNAIIDDLLKKLDHKMENPALTLSVLLLKHNDAARVATMLETIFAARQRGQTLPGETANPAEQIKVEPDSINNALIISASKENLEHIQELLEKIDVEPTIAGGLLQIFTLQYADAQRVASILKSLVSQGLYRPGAQFASGKGAGAGRDALAVSVDPRSNTLMVSASPENLAIVKEIIQKVD
ncbi:MAG: hypothetical protein JWM99_4412, partial [Verrucomicrobiales bacterium]|nr:hypothetical protein [Verrucomicrobiales bacterium]